MGGELGSKLTNRFISFVTCHLFDLDGSCFAIFKTFEMVVQPFNCFHILAVLWLEFNLIDDVIIVDCLVRFIRNIRILFGGFGFKAKDDIRKVEFLLIKLKWAVDCTH